MKIISRNSLKAKALICLCFFITIKLSAQSWDNMAGGIQDADTLLNSGNVSHLEKDTISDLLYVSGTISWAGGDSGYSKIASWNGSVWDSLPPQIWRSVGAMKMYNSELYVKGRTWSGSINCIRKWNGSGWSSFGSSGTVFSGTQAVYAFEVFNGELYAAGLFDTIDGVPAKNIAVWNGANWSALSSGADSSVYYMSVFNGELYAAGRFMTAGGIPASHIAKWNGSSWSAVGSGLYSNPFGLAILNGELFAAVDMPGARAAKWNGASWSAVGSLGNPDNPITAMCSYNSKLIIVGTFQFPSQNIAVGDGNAWYAFPCAGASSVAGGEVLLGDRNTLYFGGMLQSVCSTFVRNIAAWTEPLGINEIENQNQFIIYPNPASSSIIINSISNKASLTITEPLGKNVKQNLVLYGKNEIDISALAKGVYFVSLESERGRVTKKLVKQ